MNLGIGIDTGGTFTDAVLLDMDSGLVLAQAKALTTKHDLTIGIRQSLGRILPGQTDDIRLVSLSTTLATNALVEGMGAPVCLLLIGYDQAAASGQDLSKPLGTDRYVFIRGGHDIDGLEQAPLDLDATQEAILQHAPHVRAYAVSGYFGTRNPTHERAVREIVTQLTGLPTTAGHELTQELDALRRATTAALNASLIPLIHELIQAVRTVLHEHGIDAPLMLVKGDGSLMLAEVAQARPIETILSGPAASVVGAHYLSQSADAIVVDMGGTTTDIALVEDGRPSLTAAGARVGAWHTMVQAIDIQTVGLGGDSHVQIGAGGSLEIGPRRVVPLCVLARQFPQVRSELTTMAQDPQTDVGEIAFLLLQRRAASAAGISPAIDTLLAALEQGPLSSRRVEALLRYPSLHQRALAQLERQGIIVRSALTPTDAAHVLGLYTDWDASASLMAIEIAARVCGTSALDLAGRIVARTSARIAQEVTRKLWDEDANGSRDTSALSDAVLERLVASPTDARLRFVPTLRLPLVALGAPASVYFADVARALNAPLDLPALGPVANALGAIVGSVVAHSEATIVPSSGDQGYLVHSAPGTQAFATLEEALAHARTAARRQAEADAARFGATDVRVTLSETESTAPVGHGYSGEVFVSMRIEAQAMGRPGWEAPSTA